MIAEREHESTRIEAFSDAMFAFAATLLVVSLEVPHNFDDLLNNQRGFAPFALSFAALYFIWIAHTNVFRRYQLGDLFTLIVNGVMLFTVLFYVYPLKFTATAIVGMFTKRMEVTMLPSQTPTLFVIYGIGWCLVFLCVSLLYRHAYTIREKLGLTPLQAYDAVTHSRYYVCFVIAGLLSILVALLGIGTRFSLPGFMYATVGIFAALNGKARRKGREALAETVAEHPQLANTSAISTEMIRQALKQ